ncbi:hypothetical protein ABB37_09863 [Leptomonas pyrrhocoris]|uniref:Uncharacterized protein n=1 Tax=Leptomonas pyrrhocoris TaxID=157538 RepID=A0A0M9FPR7_LEPPY|nr:hypothetical protein ABB37_09863 [Leptomonas pyrrhocoris]KPA73419.1 hypothetical protein ABB37_09863 [Leptomonas pyrrhocoris]|eukprot:XP_015651858.1 hypothetical protein ABB37_09863 [Leptomonas pyrrhocoris]
MMKFAPSSASVRGPTATKLPALVARPPSSRPATARARLAAAAASTAATSSNAASAFVVFPELPDQLLCAPDNTIWVYGQYALTFFATEAAAQAKLERKLQAMLREAQRHYEVSRAFFHSLSPEEQQAELLRSSSNSNVAPLYRPTATAATATILSPGEAAAAAAVMMEENVYWPSRESEYLRRHRPRSQGDDAHHRSSDGGVRYNVTGHRRSGSIGSARNAWDAAGDVIAGAEDSEDSGAPYPPGLRVNLVLDIVASRKTLGAAPLRSRAYRIAERLYRRVMRRPQQQQQEQQRKSHGEMAADAAAAARTIRPGDRPTAPMNGAGETTTRAPDERVDALHDMAPYIRALVIGISDANITLVGRDVVCPYRHLPAPTPTQWRVRSALEALADASRQQQQQPRLHSASSSTGAAGAAACATGGKMAAPATPTSVAASMMLAALVAKHVLQRRSVESLVPAPYTRVAPTRLGQLDQTRLILCTPPVEWSTAGEEEA